MNTRYAPGGDIYQTLKAQYGQGAAERVYRAASGASGETVAEALGVIRGGEMQDDSTWSIFFDQITTDPLAAPIESLNNQVGNVFKNLLVNPFALLALVVVGIFVADHFFKFGIFRKLLSKF